MLKEGEPCLGKGAASLPNVFWKTDLSSRGRRRKAAVGNDPSREGGISLAACGEDGLSPLVHGSLLGHGGFSWGTEPPGSCCGKGGDSSKGFPKV